MSTKPGELHLSKTDGTGQTDPAVWGQENDGILPFSVSRETQDSHSPVPSGPARAQLTKNDFLAFCGTFHTLGYEELVFHDRKSVGMGGFCDCDAAPAKNTV